MKRRKNETGSILLESLVALSLIGMMIVTIHPLTIDLSSRLSQKRKETEYWRFAQDYALQRFYPNQAIEGTRMTDRMSVSGFWNEQGRTLYIFQDGNEVLQVDFIQSE